MDRVALSIASPAADNGEGLQPRRTRITLQTVDAVAIDADNGSHRGNAGSDGHEPALATSDAKIYGG